MEDELERWTFGADPLPQTMRAATLLRRVGATLPVSRALGGLYPAWRAAHVSPARVLAEQ